MRRTTYFVMALALVLGFTQCKKEQPAVQNDGVHITLTVDGGNKDSRVDVNPNAPVGYATVTYAIGDIIYVGNGGAYCGYLTYDGTNFTGEVNPENESDYLHFYFMGNKGTTSEPSTVSITDQASEYPVISYAHSTVLYSSSVDTYSAKLQNYCSIVKFTTNAVPMSTAITVKGMNNTVAVNFGANNAATSTSGNPYTFTKSGDGDIILHAESTTERWAILLEQDAVDNAVVTADAYYNSTCNVPAVANNAYMAANPVSISLTPAPIAGNFTVNADGKKVCFSKGNLQATTTDLGAHWTWAFAENQWDRVGNATANTDITGNGTVSANGTVDLFGWSTSTTYLGINNSTANNDYRGDFVDWASHADVTAGIGTGWRTLTSEEWRYLFVTRTTTSGYHYCKAQVNGMPGVILLPDDWSTSYHSLAFCDVVELSFDASNIDGISLEDWNNDFVPHGAVFLPTTGQRDNKTVENPNGRLYYWSSTSGANTSGTSANANQMYIFGTSLAPDAGAGRHYGNAVRLVRDVE